MARNRPKPSRAAGPLSTMFGSSAPTAGPSTNNAATAGNMGGGTAKVAGPQQPQNAYRPGPTGNSMPPAAQPAGAGGPAGPAAAPPAAPANIVNIPIAKLANGPGTGASGSSGPAAPPPTPGPTG